MTTTVTTTYKAVWIDDDVSRAERWQGGLSGSLLGKSVEINLECFEVTKNLLHEIPDRLKAWLQSLPDLLIIDQKFTQAEPLPFDIHGSSLAHLLRLKMPSTPIVCVTAQTIDSDDFNIEDLSEYTYLFSIDKLSDQTQQERLFSIAQDFKILCFDSKKPVRALLVDALRPPEVDRAALLSILPEEFESLHLHGTTPHRMAKWILTVLMQRPGFLWDALDAATYVGLSEEAFVRTYEIFRSALYQGPFATDSRPLWWASSIADALYKAVHKNYAHLSPADAGRTLPSIKEKDFSSCVVSGVIPDVVVYADESKSVRYPVALRYAVPLSEAEGSIPGFPPRLKLANERKG